MNRANRPRLSRISGSSYDSRLMSRAGDGSTLTLDFTTGQLDPRLTFSRTSNATFINSGGLVEWAAANMMTRSQGQDNNSYWNAFGTSVTRAANQSDPLGGTGAVKLDYDATSADAVISRVVTVSQGLTYTLSVWLRADSGTVNNVRLGRGASAAGAFFPSLTTSWQRFSLTFVATGGSDGIELRVLTSGSPKTASFHVFGAQLEPGSTMRDYNPALLDVPYHAPRFDYDPTTLAPKGLLIEGSANNLCLRSEDFGNASWQVDNSGATNPVVSTVSQTAPNGASSVNRVTLNKTGGTFSRLYQAITGTAGQTYTLSVWMKANTANGGAATQNVSLRIGGSNGVNCVVTTTWQRFTHPAFAIIGTDANFQLLLWDNVPANDETADVLVWGAQVELGSGASSYIPTGASQVTRNADECQILNLTTFGFNASEGTIYTDVGQRRNTGSQRNYTFLPASGNNNQIFEGSGTALNVYSSGSFVAQIGTSLLSASRIAAVYKVNDYAVSINGAAVVTDTSGAVPSSLTKLTIGGSIVNAAAYANGHIRVFKYWPTRLPDATLQSLTT